MQRKKKVQDKGKHKPLTRVRRRNKKGDRGKIKRRDRKKKLINSQWRGRGEGPLVTVIEGTHSSSFSLHHFHLWHLYGKSPCKALLRGAPVGGAAFPRLRLENVRSRERGCVLLDKRLVKNDEGETGDLGEKGNEKERRDRKSV